MQTIPFNKAKVRFHIARSAFFVVALLLLTAYTNAVIAFPAAIASLGYFFITFYIARWAFYKSAVIIDAEGFRDRTMYYTTKKILWKDVIDMEMFDFRNNTNIAIYLRNKEQYAPSTIKKFTRIPTNIMEKQLGTPVILNPTFLDTTADDLYDILKEAWRKAC